MANPHHIQVKILQPTAYKHHIILCQSLYSRAINVGYIENNQFIPGRLNFGVKRMEHTLQAMVETFKTEVVQDIIKKYSPQEISTVTVIREAIAYQLSQALYHSGIHDHYGDAFISSFHKKIEGKIVSEYSYENTEGLHPTGLWIIGDSICKGRNLIATLNSLLAQFTPKEILFIAPIASRVGIDVLSSIAAAKNIPTTFVTWGALFGVADNHYDMPWGHQDTEVLDQRDQEVFLNMYGPKLCMGGDFGNDYFSPSIAKKFYEEQLVEHAITPKFPTTKELLQTYTKEELLIV